MRRMLLSGPLGLALLLLHLLGAVPARTAVVEDAGDPIRSLSPGELALRSNSLAVLPQDGRALYFQAIDSARREIWIEICVLEDPLILERLRAALRRGVRVRVIVDRGKYEALPSESTNLQRYLTASGGELHLSNPMFPRSFPKIILIDSRLLVYGSACLDETTFKQYRDFAHLSTRAGVLRELHRLFENDWAHSAAVGQQPPAFNPTPPILESGLIISPVNGANELVGLYQKARWTLDVYTELLGNPVLESELVAAVHRGVRVRLIAPLKVNGATLEVQQQQVASLSALVAAGVRAHVSGPSESAALPYMHARAAVIDGRIAYLGSISLSPDSTASNREMGLIQREEAVVIRLQNQFESDFRFRTTAF